MYVHDYLNNSMHKKSRINFVQNNNNITYNNNLPKINNSSQNNLNITSPSTNTNYLYNPNNININQNTTNLSPSYPSYNTYPSAYTHQNKPTNNHIIPLSI